MRVFICIAIVLSVLNLNVYGESKLKNNGNSKAPAVFYPQKYITDDALLALNMQMYKIIRAKQDRQNIDETLINAFLVALESSPEKERYSIQAYETLLDLSNSALVSGEYFQNYFSQNKEYYLTLNAPFREYLFDKMKNLQRISDAELKPLEDFSIWIVEDDEMAQKIYDYCAEQTPTDSELAEQWLEFLIQGCAHDLKYEVSDYYNIPKSQRDYKKMRYLDKQIESICQKELAFARAYFEPIYTDGTTIKSEITGRELPNIICENSEGGRYCKYKLKKPLKLKGTLSAITRMGDECDGELQMVWFEPSKEEIAQKALPDVLHSFYLSNGLEKLPLKLPQWFKDGVWGEISFEAQISMGDFYADYSACSAGDSTKTENITILKQGQEKQYDREDYGSEEVKLKSKDDYVNLRQSPNGKVLAHIELKDSKDYFIVELIQDKNYNENSQWLKVLYFPPHKEKAKDAIMGYIHKSQIAKDD